MFNGKLDRYRGLLIAVTSLVVFFLGYLIVNSAIQKQANISAIFAGTVNAVANNVSALNSADADAVKKISAQLNAVTNGQAVPGISKTAGPALDTFLSPEKSSITNVMTALESGDLAKAKSSIKLINESVQNKAEKRSTLVSTLQIVAAILTILLYFLIVIPLMLRLNKSDETEVSSKKETEGIMGTVSEGLFLLGSDHEIGLEQSASLKTMFKLERDLEGNFFDFILQYVTTDAVNIAKDYIELLFGDRVKERLVEDLNPLKQVEINLIRRDGSYENRYLDFKFKRVLVDGKLSHLLGSVTDVTRQVTLEKQLIESKEEQEAQIDLLMSILHVDNRQLNSFFSSTSESLNRINEKLEERGHTDGQIRGKLREIGRDVHRIKGDAASLNLHNFEFAAHALEDEMDTVQKENKKISGKHLLPMATKLRDLFAELDRMKALMNKFSSAMTESNSAAPAAELIQELSGETPLADPVEEISDLSIGVDSPSENQIVESAPEQSIEVDADAKSEAPASDETLHTSLERLAKTVGKRNGVDVTFVSTGLTDKNLPEHLTDAVYSTMVQLVRNSIVHGGQTPDERSADGKSAELNIQAKFSISDKGYRLALIDDGKGVDTDKVIERAVNQGLISAKQSESIDSKKALTLMFMPGFSSKTDVSIDGGRGVGLDVVLDLTKQHKGQISVKSSKGNFCKFMFTYPID